MNRRFKPWINIYPATAEVREPMAHLLQEWSGGRSEGIDRIQPGCNCGFPQPYWQVTAAALREHGSLPFTSRGRTIRWRWWHLCTAGSRFDVTEADLPESVQR